MRMLSIRISSWPVCSGYASVPGAYAQHFLKGMRSVHALVPDVYAQCTHQFLTRMLSARISSWRACSVHASIPYAHAEGIQNEHLKNTKTDAHAEHVRQELMRMLSVRISSWRARSWCASVPDPYAQRAHKGRSMRVRNSIFLIILKYLKHQKFLKISVDANKWSQKLLGKIFFFCPNSKKNLLKIKLSIRVRNIAAPNEPLNIKKTNFYFNPKVAPPSIETLWCKNHQNPSYQKSHTWAPLNVNGRNRGFPPMLISFNFFWNLKGTTFSWGECYIVHYTYPYNMGIRYAVPWMLQLKFPNFYSTGADKFYISW
jgi:hypothetical protein